MIYFISPHNDGYTHVTLSEETAIKRERKSWRHQWPGIKDERSDGDCLYDFMVCNWARYVVETSNDYCI